MKVPIATPKYVKAIGEKPMVGARPTVSDVEGPAARCGQRGADLSNSGKNHLDSRSVPLR
jgi:hypothetical protein